MPRIDPTKLLECLKILLSPSGGIKSSQEVKRLANLMTKFSKKLVSKCIYIEILKCSETDLLCQFMQASGWTLVHLWLTDAMNSQNWPLVHEILELLLLCPVDVERLKSNNLPKLVKQLTKDEHPGEVKLLAETLVQQWLRIVRGEALPSSSMSAASDVTSENETSQDVPTTESETVKSGDVPEKQEKIVLKLSVKDGKNVIIKKSHSKDDVAAAPLVDKSSTETADSDGTDSTSMTESKSDDLEKSEREKKHEKDKKKSSSSSKTSSTHKSHSSSHKASSSSSSKHKSSSSSRDKEKDKKSSSSSHHKSSSSKSSSSKSSSSRSGREKKKEKEPEMLEADKVAKTLAELQPEKLTKLGKIPKKPRTDETDEKKSSKPVPAPTAPKVKPTFSIEERDPEKKTVKTLNSKFRSTGLEEEAPPPPSRKVLKKPSTTSSLAPVLTTGIKRVSPPRTSIGKDPALSPPVEKKPKLQDDTRPNGVKPPKPKSHTLVETDLFSDALKMESTSRKRAIDAKKRKRRLSASDKTPQSPTTPTTPGFPMKFYQDTLEEGDDKKSGNKDQSPEKDSDDVNKTKKLRSSTSLEENSDKVTVTEEDTVMEVAEKKPPGIGTGPDGPPGILKVFNSRSKKKSIQWRAQEDLVEIRYFELDVTERVNVNRQFSECRQAEIMLEREKMIMARNLPKEDFMEAKTSWTQLIEVDGVPKHPNGEQSTERKTQQERERSVLPALWNIAMLPVSPTEPDNETNNTFVEPKVIPIDDLTGNPEGVNDFTHMAWPESKGEAPIINNPNNLNHFVSYNNQFPNATPYTTPATLQQPPPGAGPWANVPPVLALGQPPPFVDPTINPLAAFNLPGNQFIGLPPISNNFTGPPPMNFQNNNNHPRNDRGNWVRGNADRNGRWNDRDRRNYNSDRDRRDRRDDRDTRGTRPGVCRQFVKYGNCRQGDKCIYYHPVR